MSCKEKVIGAGGMELVPLGVFSSQSEFPPIGRLAKGGLDLLCVPKFDK